MGNDEDLVARVRRGDHRAFDALVQRHYRMVRRIAYRYAAVSADADDLAQEAFVTAYQRLHQLRQPDRFAGWLAAIARSEGLMWQRRRLAQPTLIPLDDGRAVSDPIVPADDWEALRREAVRDAVADALLHLTAEQRQAVQLHYLAGCDYLETAALLDVPVAAVRGRLHRARGALRKELQKMTAISASEWELTDRDLDAVRAAAGMACADPERVALNALYFDGKGRMISSDSHRLLCYASPSPEGVPSVLVHADLGRALRDHPQVRRATLVLTSEEAVLRPASGEEIRAPLVDVSYARWEKVVPAESRLSATARAGDWLSALEMLARHREARVMPPVDPRAPNRILVALSPGEGRITLREGEWPPSDSGIAWESSVSFPAEFARGDQELVIAANAAYVEAAVRALGLQPDELAEMCATGEEGPFTIRAARNGHAFVVTMPMQRHVSAASAESG